MSITRRRVTIRKERTKIAGVVEIVIVIEMTGEVIIGETNGRGAGVGIGSMTVIEVISIGIGLIEIEKIETGIDMSVT